MFFNVALKIKLIYCMIYQTHIPYYSLLLYTNIILYSQIVGTRYLMKTSKGFTNPFIEVELVGTEYDCCRYKPSTKGTSDYTFLSIIYYKLPKI